MPDFGEDLRGLARHGQRTGRLAGAADIRARADRRRKRRYVATGALGVALVGALGVGIAAAQPGPHPLPPAASASVAPDVFSGHRQVVFEVLDVGQPVAGAVLAVGSGGRLQIGTAGDRALFVPVPAGSGRYLIKTAVLRQAGAALCLTLRTNGSQPLTVVTATCVAKDTKQLFTFKSNGPDEKKRLNYGIAQSGAFLQSSGGLLVAQETGGYLSDLTVVPIDQGPSTLPN